LCREALAWRQLRHPCIVPFLGLYQDCDLRSSVCMISPCMRGGNLSTHAERERERLHLLPVIRDILEGLCYLHGQHYVHGDLRAVNILLDENGRAYISDFGLISLLDQIHDKSTKGRGNPRWTAPELFESDFKRTFSTDMYSFGCLCLEIITLKPPFYEIPRDCSVIACLLKG
ncbi:kinase-like protein, partial [Punctularia strigosozonata HHB-11173 SS5]